MPEPASPSVAAGTNPEAVPVRAAAVLAARIAEIATAAAGLVITARALGPDLFGLLPTVAAITGVVLFASDLGISNATGVLAARAIVEGRSPGAALRAGIYLRTALAGVGLLLMFGGAEPLAAFLREPRLASLTRIASAFLLADGALHLVQRSLEGVQRAYALAVVRAVAGCLAPVLATAAAVLFADPASVIWGRAIGSAAGAALGFALLARSCRGPREPGVGRRIVSYGRHLVLVTGSYIIFIQVDILVVKWLLGTEDAAYYGAAALVAERLCAPAAALAAVGAPLLAGLKGRLDAPAPGAPAEAATPAPLAPLVQRLIGVTLIAYLPGAALLSALADPLIPAVFGEAYRPAVPVFRIYGPATLLLALQFVLGAGLDYAGLARVRGRLLLAAALLNLALDLALCPRFRVSGAALGTLLAAAPLVLLYGSLLLRASGLRPADLGPVFLRCLGTALAAALVAWTTARLVHPAWLAAAAGLVAGGLTAALAARLAGLFPGRGADRRWPPSAGGAGGAAGG